VIRDRRIALFASSVTLFHFANAAMLPLAGELLAVNKTDGASLYMSGCIIAAQLVMVPVAALSGMAAERWGRKPVFLIGFAVLPIRGLLYTLSAKPSFVVAVQLLDGIGAGIFGVLAVLMVADLTKGTGRFNATQGAIATAQGCGAALSNVVAGYIVSAAGYGAAFLSLAGIAVIALILFCIAVPETRNDKPHTGRRRRRQGECEGCPSWSGVPLSKPGHPLKPVRLVE
jgi:MFS family permease